VPDESREQAELQRRQRDGGRADRHLAGGEVDRHGGVDVGLAHLGRAAGAAQQRLDPREQLLAAERLDHVVVGAGLEPPHLVELAGARREHQDRHVGEVADAFERLPAVHLGHSHVENDERRADGVQAAQRLAAAGRLADGVPGPLQQDADQVADVRFVVDDQYR
jgi:hypothetical protein